jgi:hypothetical protein
MHSTNLLPKSLQEALRQLVERINSSGAGVSVVLLSTSEGVPLARVYAEGHEDQWSEEVISSIESTWAPAAKQFPLLNLGEVRVVTAMYDQISLLHVYLTPVVRIKNHRMNGTGTT